LVEVGERAGAKLAFLVQSANEIPWEKIKNFKTFGITAGASAPEILVDEIISSFKERFEANVSTITTATENVAFKLPRQLREDA
jgi:4-hydroxy-3-methylbut-2-enyl diphosphate reductase